MLEEFREKNIKVAYPDKASDDEKNQARKESIQDHFQKNLVISKEKVAQSLKDDRITAIQNIDFSKANPNNTHFMNELSFAGKGIAQGFMEVFQVEVNSAVDQYMERKHIIEQRKDNGEKRAFIGEFKNSKLYKRTPYFDNKETIEKSMKQKMEMMKREKEQSKQQKQEISRSRSLNHEED